MNFAYLKQGRSYKLRLHKCFSFFKWGSTASWSLLKHAFELFCLKDMLSMKAFEHDVAVLYNCCNIQCTWLVILPHILYLCFVITVWLMLLSLFIDLKVSVMKCGGMGRLFLTWSKAMLLQLVCGPVDYVYGFMQHLLIMIKIKLGQNLGTNTIY